MKTLVQLGYNTIDVYFPWNYHELEPGTWNFQGQRDAAAFLQMAKEAGLWVIARPGPYICSEWDGGALPAYLSATPDLRLRNADAPYLQAVRRWYDQILPIIVGFQIDQGGTVIMVQIENELDFYDCHDRPAMMSALRDMALANGITVPLIACAGEGDLPGATGSVDGVVPACNVYFDERDPQIEERVRHYTNLMHGQGYPLGIIETNRSHADLRRLVISGAKLVGPYLQTGGTDFGFTTGITNWGEPLAFMTSHYDFGGMLSPGGFVRPEGFEARLFTRMLEALGSAAALSTPVGEPPVCVTGDVVPSALALDGGGWLVSLANPGEDTIPVSFSDGSERIPRKVGLQVAPQRCPYIIYDLPLSAWGMDGQIAYSTSELVGREALADHLKLTFLTGDQTEVVLRLPGARLGDNSGWQVEQDGDDWLFWKTDDQKAFAELCFPDDRRIHLLAVDRETAAGFSIAEINPANPNAAAITELEWSTEQLDPCSDAWLSNARACDPNRLHLEQNGVYRGFAWYRSSDFAREPKGLLLRAGADVLSVYAGSQFLGSHVPGGLNTYLPWRHNLAFGQENPITIRAEIWGHANFDDGRLPALRLNSLRGMAGAVAVWDVQNLTPNWYYQDGAQYPADLVDPYWPYIYFGGWSTTKEPAPGIYYRQVFFSDECDSRVLHFPELKVNVRVYVDQELAGEATPFNPWVDLSCITRPGKAVRLAVIVDRQLRLTAGQVILYQGQAISNWQVQGWEEADFAGLLTSSPEVQQPVELPFTRPPGELTWMHGQIPESAVPEAALDMVFSGRNLKLSVWLGERLVGRVWLPSQNRPRMAGGIDNRVYLPASWIAKANGKVHLLIESVGEDEGILTEAALVFDS